MSLEELIKMQNRLEDQIATMQDASYDLGKDIFEGFKKLPEDKIFEYYNMMNRENNSLIRYDIFKKFVYGNEDVLRRFEK
ncbi:hypothetical protein MG295_00178 [Bacillus phage vB_BcgM]|nr:hypothetical protein MG295_00178 [Bacillus phage vB_BcgM]